jgi:hypothetical protein
MKDAPISCFYIIILDVILLHVDMLSAFKLSVLLLNIIMLNVTMVSVITLNVVMLSVIMQNVVLLSVSAPPFVPWRISKEHNRNIFLSQRSKFSVQKILLFSFISNQNKQQ